MALTFDEVWGRVLRHEGEQFRTRTGQVFRYEVVDNNKVRVTVADAVLSRDDLERYFRQAVEAGTGRIAVLAGGPSFVWAILTDARIQGE